MSRNCSVHDELMIMKLCMYVGYHDANNVSNFGGDPVFQLNLKTFLFKKLGSLLSARCRHRSMKSSSMEDHNSLSTAIVSPERKRTPLDALAPWPTAQWRQYGLYVCMYV